MNWQTLKHASLDDLLEWAESQPWCRAMADCAQDAIWHSEGDVWTHTKMVCQQLAGLSEWATASLHHATLGSPAVTWTFRFEQDAEGTWNAVSHK